MSEASNYSTLEQGKLAFFSKKAKQSKQLCLHCGHKRTWLKQCRLGLSPDNCSQFQKLTPFPAKIRCIAQRRLNH